jgi:hypothetical protein
MEVGQGRDQSHAAAAAHRSPTVLGNRYTVDIEHTCTMITAPPAHTNKQYTHTHWSSPSVHLADQLAWSGLLACLLIGSLLACIASIVCWSYNN